MKVLQVFHYTSNIYIVYFRIWSFVANNILSIIHSLSERMTQLMKQKTLVRSLFGLFATSGVVAAVATLRQKTIQKIDLANNPKRRFAISHSFGIARKIVTQNAEPIPFTGGIIRSTCGILVYDMSNVPMTQNGIIQCDVHMGMIHLILPSNVNIDFDYKDLFGQSNCTDNRFVALNTPVITVRASTFMGLFSVTKKEPTNV